MQAIWKAIIAIEDAWGHMTPKSTMDELTILELQRSLMDAAAACELHGIDSAPLSALSRTGSWKDAGRTMDIVQRLRAKLCAIGSRAMRNSKAPFVYLGSAQTPATEPAATQGANLQPLRDRHVNALEAMVALKATDRDRRRTSQEIAVAADGPQADGETYKRPLADLVRWRYVESESGRRGGAWITKQGRAALRDHKRTRK